MKETVSHETALCETYTESIRPEEPAAARTIAHLYAEQTAIPANALLKESEHLTNPFKSKCLSTNNHFNQTNIHSYSLSNTYILPSEHHFHTIDYYIYTLKHILI